jgi:NAD(P)-dependent dehydrogenase (short-subunit alcohol dehydrogenase family)
MLERQSIQSEAIGALGAIEPAVSTAYRAAAAACAVIWEWKGLNTMKLQDQVAIVTGAGRNIGEEIAKLFAAEGAKVALVDLDKARGERVADAIKAAGGDATAFVADVSKGSAVAALVADVVARYGRIDILVNNVAISDNKHIFDISEDEWDRVMAVTLKSQFLMGKFVGQQMAAQGSGGGAGGGRIVNIGSTSGFTGRSRAIAYSAAKGGVANLTRAMAAQLAPHKIRVNAIVPNKIGSPVGRDEFDPSRPVPNMAKRPGQPDEAAKAVLFLVTDDSSFVYGANLFVDGGVSAMDLS